MKRRKPRKNRIGLAVMSLFGVGVLTGGCAVAGAVVFASNRPELAKFLHEPGKMPFSVPVVASVPTPARPLTLADAELTTEPITFSHHPNKWEGRVIALDWCHVQRIDGTTVVLNPGVRCQFAEQITQPGHYVKIVGRVEGGGLVECRLVK